MRFVQHDGRRSICPAGGGALVPLTDAGLRLTSRLIVSTESPSPSHHQMFVRRSPWRWGSRWDDFQLVTPSRGDPGHDDMNEWMRSAALLGEMADEAARAGALDDLGIAPASSWYPVAPVSRFGDYWHLVVHMLSWKRVIGAETSIWWRIKSLEPPGVTAVSDLRGPLSQSSEEAALLIESLSGRSAEGGGTADLVINEPLTPVATPVEIFQAVGDGRIGPDGSRICFGLEEIVGKYLEERSDVTGLNQRPATATPETAETAVPLVIEGFEIRRGDRVARLGNTMSFKILEKLLAESGRYVPHSEIERAAWGDIASRSASLHQHVAKIRKKLSEAGFDDVEIDGSEAGHYRLVLQQKQSKI